MSYCSPGRVRDFLEEARDTVRAEVTRINYDTPSFWVDYMPKDSFDLGKGWEQQQKYYEQSYIDAHSAWRRVSEEVANKTACDVTPEIVRYGSTFTSFGMERLEVRGPDLCLLDIVDMQSFSEELTRQYEQLARVGRFKFENRYRDAHIFYSGAKYLAVPDGNGGMPHSTAAFPTAAGVNVALASQTMLDYFALIFDSEGGWNDNMGMDDGAPYYMCIASNDVTDHILRSDGQARDDIRRSSMRDELISRWHSNLLYKRWMHINDTQAPRFSFDATTNTFARVPYFIEETTTIGQKAVPNPLWASAEYECVTLIANRRGPECLMMPQISNPGGNTDFDIVHNEFNFEFINYGTNDTNPKRNHGYFLGDAMEAINPRENRFVINLMVKRNVNYIVFDEPTAPAGSVPAEGTLALYTDPDKCSILPAQACANYADFTCDVSVTDRLTLFPIRDGSVSDAPADTVKIQGAGDTIFTVDSIADGPNGETNAMVTFSYSEASHGGKVDCSALVLDWKLRDDSTNVDVEDGPDASNSPS